MENRWISRGDELAPFRGGSSRHEPTRHQALRTRRRARREHGRARHRPGVESALPTGHDRRARRVGRSSGGPARRPAGRSPARAASRRDGGTRDPPAGIRDGPAGRRSRVVGRADRAAVAQSSRMDQPIRAAARDPVREPTAHRVAHAAPRHRHSGRRRARRALGARPPHGGVRPAGRRHPVRAAVDRR